jgi:aminoglycoside phosphotransferase (APT) family kinase protein
VEFRRRRPSPQTLDWVEGATGGKVVAWRRLTGGISSAVHRVTVDHGGYRDVLVLRQCEREFFGFAGSDTTELVRREAWVLRAAHDAGLPAAEPLAVDADGTETSGHPSLLMTRLPGRVDVTPVDPEGWLREIAVVAAKIHGAPIAAGPFRPRADADAPAVPGSATRPELWRAAFSILRQPAPEPVTCFLHRDYQHFNLLWRRGRLTGVVDWAMACDGPADFDLGHCRLNVAVLFGADRAERLRLAYEAEAGRATDPWWDLYALTAYADAWRRFIPVQVAGRAPVDTDGMTSRVEDLLAATLKRF